MNTAQLIPNLKLLRLSGMLDRTALISLVDRGHYLAFQLLDAQLSTVH